MVYLKIEDLCEKVQNTVRSGKPFMSYQEIWTLLCGYLESRMSSKKESDILNAFLKFHSDRV